MFQFTANITKPLKS